MEKAQHAARLREAIARAQMTRDTVADALGVKARTITNWTTGATMPGALEREKLRAVFPGYDNPGDPVEVAIMASGLTEDRRYALVGAYKRMLREQDDEAQLRPARPA